MRGQVDAGVLGNVWLAWAYFSVRVPSSRSPGHIFERKPASGSECRRLAWIAMRSCSLQFAYATLAVPDDQGKGR